MSAVVTNYIVVRGSVFSADCTVFGLDKPDEQEQVLAQYPSSGDVMNGKIVKAQAVVVLNLLARIGYKVVSSTGEAETIWTLEARRTVPLQPAQPKQEPQPLKFPMNLQRMSVHRDCLGHGSANLTTHEHETCNHSSAQPSVHQSLDELEFERGIWSAALENNIGRVRKLLSSTSPDANDTAGYTALHYAARAGHLEICRLLLSHRASVDCRTRAGQATPLHRAATAGRLEVCQLLLDNKADVQAVDADGKTALDRAKESRQNTVVTLLSKFTA